MMLDLKDIEDCLDAEAWEVPMRLNLAEGLWAAGIGVGAPDRGWAGDHDERAEDGR